VNDRCIPQNSALYIYGLDYACVCVCVCMSRRTGHQISRSFPVSQFKVTFYNIYTDYSLIHQIHKILTIKQEAINTSSNTGKRTVKAFMELQVFRQEKMYLTN